MIRLQFLPVAMVLGVASLAHAQEKPWVEKTAAIGAVGAMPAGRLSGEALERLTETGEALFSAKFTLLDGAGRPSATQAIIPTMARSRATNQFSRISGPDANACSSCHNDPVPGGAGDFVTTTFVSEGFAIAELDTTDPQFSNERGTNHLFGAGLIELLAREMSADLAAIRNEALNQAAGTGDPVRLLLESKGVTFGHVTAYPDGIINLEEVEGVDSDLVIRPFSQKGVMTSLRQFTINAMNDHHGMQAEERFGARWTGSSDHDGDEHHDELRAGDISALVAWQATLPAPSRLRPDNAAWREAADRGEKLMSEFDCNACHIGALPLDSLAFQDPGPLDVAGTLNRRQVEATAIYDLGLREWTLDLERDEQGRVMVPLFGDLKRHKITDSRNEALGNELLSQRFVDRNWFMTAELWGLASTAPYGHRNDFTTLDSVIRAHGGEAAEAAGKYSDASEADRSDLIAFLKTLAIRP